MNLGDYLRTQREAIGLGLRETARQARMSPSYLCRIETDPNTSPPSEATLRRLCDVIGADPAPVLALAGRLPKALVDYLLSHPEEVERINRRAKP